jgi:hypothetical protein
MGAGQAHRVAGDVVLEAYGASLLCAQTTHISRRQLGESARHLLLVGVGTPHVQDQREDVHEVAEKQQGQKTPLLGCGRNRSCHVIQNAVERVAAEVVVHHATVDGGCVPRPSARRCQREPLQEQSSQQQDKRIPQQDEHGQRSVAGGGAQQQDGPEEDQPQVQNNRPHQLTPLLHSSSTIIIIARVSSTDARQLLCRKQDKHLPHKHRHIKPTPEIIPHGAIWYGVGVS